MGSRARIAVAGTAAVAAGAWWARTHPSACPYAARFLVDIPRPILTRGRLREILEPQAGERILEVGPGSGQFTLEMAEWVGPSGEIEIFDLQQGFLDQTTSRARERGVANVNPTQGNAESLPYEDEGFDAAVLITVLGEIPDRGAALREHHRVLKPGGRLIVGELSIGDPHFVTFGTVRDRAEGAGFRYERRSGPAVGFYARFVK